LSVFKEAIREVEQIVEDAEEEKEEASTQSPSHG